MSVIKWKNRENRLGLNAKNISTRIHTTWKYLKLRYNFHYYFWCTVGSNASLSVGCYGLMGYNVSELQKSEINTFFL